MKVNSLFRSIQREVIQREKKEHVIMGVQRYYLLFTFFFLSAAVLSIYLFINLNHNNPVFIYLNLTALIINILFIVYIFKKGMTKPIVYSFELFVTLILFYFYLNGGDNLSGPFFSVSYPIITIFLLGRKKGNWFSFLFFLICIVFYFIFNNSTWFPQYHTSDLISYLILYLVLGILANLYEYALDNYSNSLLKMINRIQRKNQINMDLVRTSELLLSILSHDLKNSIGSTHTFIKILAEEAEDRGEEINPALEQIENMLYNSSEIISRTMQLFKLKNKKNIVGSEQFNLRSLIAHAIREQKANAELKNIKLVSDINTSNLVCSNEQIILIIIRNLLNNAIKFSKTNSSVFINAKQNGKLIKISIKDSGIGMNEKTIQQLKSKKISNPKYGTSGEKGSGIGLFICQELLTLLKSNLQIDSDLGKGSTFSFEFISY